MEKRFICLPSRSEVLEFILPVDRDGKRARLINIAADHSAKLIIFIKGRSKNGRRNAIADNQNENKIIIFPNCQKNSIKKATPNG